MPKRLEKLARFVIEAVPVFKSCKVEKVLDLGCGVGRHCIYLAKNGFDVIGVDVSKHALIMAKEWVRKEMVVNTSFIQASMTNLPLLIVILMQSSASALYTMPSRETLSML
ncbi:MAG: class I SAM-dependent methyltransferase [Candidatus Bathyarchaeota archaeon]|nr:class I SAM-dependent methyltransferase [Candidatus Bathyarchaeota archaeon]